MPQHALHIRFLTPAMLAFACVAAGCTGSPSPARPTPLAPQKDSAAIVPPGEGAEAIAAVRRATAAFHDVDAAVAAGYQSPVGIPCVESPAGGMGVHAPNPALTGTLPVDPEHPEVLLFLPKNGGGFRLIGVEYFQAVLLGNTATGAVAPWFSATHWPGGYEVVNPAPSLFGHTFQGPMAGHEPGMPWHYDLHVWAWAPNPNGTFAQWNPSISCP